MTAGTRIELPGILDTVAADALAHSLMAARGDALTLEGGSALRIGGAALQVLLSARRQWLEDGHGWKIAAPSPELREALELMDASGLLEEFTNV